MIFLAGRDRYTQRTLLRDIHDRLTNQAGCEDVRYRPSRRRPRYMIADVAPTTFLGESYERESVRLAVRFWYPAGVNHEYYRINWIEPERHLMLGFHQMPTTKISVPVTSSSITRILPLIDMKPHFSMHIRSPCLMTDSSNCQQH